MRLALLPEVEDAFKSCGISSEEYSGLTDKQVVDRLLQLLQKKPDKFHTLAKALGECRASQAARLLSRGLDSSNEYQVASAADALGKIGDKSAEGRLRSLLLHEDKRVRVAAAGALARLGEAEGLQELRRLIREREPWAESGASLPDYLEVKCAKILYECGDPSGLELLIEYLDHPDWWGAFCALEALREVKAPECADAVKMRMPKYPHVGQILLCVEILAGLGDFSELPRLSDILTAGRKEDRIAAARVCGRLGLAAHVEPLRNLLRVEGDADVRLAIKRAIERIEETSAVPVSKMLGLEVPKDSLDLINQLGQKLLRDPLLDRVRERKAEEEIRYFTAQLKRGGELCEALNRLGFAYLYSARYSEVEKCFRRVLAEKPDDPVALFGLTRVGIRLKKEEPRESLKNLLKIEKTITEPFVDLYDWPGNDLYLWLGTCYLEMGDLPNAIKYLEKAINLNDDVVSGHKQLGRALLANSQLDRAVQALKRAVELHPRDNEAHLYLAAIYQALGQQRKAQERLEQADTIFAAPVRLTPQAQAEIRAQVMRAMSKHLPIKGNDGSSGRLPKTS